MMFRSVRARSGEQWRCLPGDDFIPKAGGELTHAITIQRPRAEVWPWLVQMGAGRAGWYSYDRIDNGGQHSSEQILPELQHLEVGDLFPAMPGAPDGFVVLNYQPERFLILGWPTAEGCCVVVTWAFILEEPAPDTTRLLVRVRVGRQYRPPFGLPRWTMKALVPFGHWIMERKQLREIARRAEAEFGRGTLPAER